MISCHKLLLFNGFFLPLILNSSDQPAVLHKRIQLSPHITQKLLAKIPELRKPIRKGTDSKSQLVQLYVGQDPMDKVLEYNGKIKSLEDNIKRIAQLIGETLKPIQDELTATLPMWQTYDDTEDYELARQNLLFIEQTMAFDPTSIAIPQVINREKFIKKIKDEDALFNQLITKKNTDNQVYYSISSDSKDSTQDYKRQTSLAGLIQINQLLPDIILKENTLLDYIERIKLASDRGRGTIRLYHEGTLIQANQDIAKINMFLREDPGDNKYLIHPLFRCELIKKTFLNQMRLLYSLQSIFRSPHFVFSKEYQRTCKKNLSLVDVLGKLATTYFGMWKTMKAGSLFLNTIDDRTQFCYHCKSSRKAFLKCQSCRTTYCSDECRTNHRDAHAAFCQLPSSNSKISFTYDKENDEWSISDQNHERYTFAHVLDDNRDEAITLFHSNTKEQFDLPLIEGIYCACSVKRRLWIPIKQKSLMPFLVDFYLRDESLDAVVE